jgi:hypothetical protein
MKTKQILSNNWGIIASVILCIFIYLNYTNPLAQLLSGFLFILPSCKN